MRHAKGPGRTEEAALGAADLLAGSVVEVDDDRSLRAGFPRLIHHSIKAAAPLRVIYVELTKKPVPDLTSSRLFGS